MEFAEITKNTARELVNLLGFKDCLIDSEIENGRLRLNIKLDEAGFLIGKEGENLRALHHIFLLMVSKKIGRPVYGNEVFLDVNNYQKERESYLEALAKNTAQAVIDTKKEQELSPMSASDRRVVHTTIEKIEGVTSESLGEGEARRVIVKPASDTNYE